MNGVRTATPNAFHPAYAGNTFLMLKPTITFILALVTGIASSQITPEKYAGTVTAADLKSHLVVLAGPDMEGRETATEGQRKAAQYIEDHFKLLGLTPGNQGSYQQVFTLMQDTMLSSHLTIGKKKYVFGKDFMASALVNKNNHVEAKKIVFAGYGISQPGYDDYSDLDIKGAIVVLALGEPRDGNQFLISGSERMSTWSTLKTKMQVAFDKGAAGILVVSPRLRTIDSSTASRLRKTNTYLPGPDWEEAYKLTAAEISQAIFADVFGRVYADSMISKLGRAESFAQQEHKSLNKKVVFTYEEKSFVKGNTSNVIGVLEGTDKRNEYLFLTAHYDHLGKKDGVIYYGADDDGSGTVSVLEMAEAFAKAKADGNGPRRTIVFMTVSGEEQGLWGSQYYSNNPVYPLESTTADLNTDMVGRVDPKRKYGDSLNYIYVIGDDKLSSDLKTITESVNNRYTHLELDNKYNDPADPERIYYRSDHYNFARKGVPILFYFNGTHRDYHQPTDTIEKINFNLMEKRVHLIFYTAWEIANRESLLKRDIPLN